MQFIINKSNSPSTILSQGLADQFGYIPMRVDLVVIGSGALLHGLSNLTHSNNIIHHVSYMGPNNNCYLTQAHRNQCIIFIQHNPPYENHETSMVNMLSSPFFSYADMVVDVTSEYPRFLKNRSLGVLDLGETADLHMFNSEMTKWANRINSKTLWHD